MKSGIVIKRFFAHPIYYLITMVNSLQKSRNDRLVILMYHRVIRKSDSESHVQEGMYVEPNTFMTHIEFVKEHFNVVPIENLTYVNRLKNIGSNGKPFCVITFDDGWKDFYENAYPILKAYDVSATVFLPTDFIGTTKKFWTERLANIIKNLHGKEIDLRNVKNHKHYMITQIVKMTGSNDEKIENATEAMKSLSADDINRILTDMEDRWEIDREKTGRSFLSWEEVKEMYRSGIILFGSHTSSHQILTTIPENMIRDELVQSKNKLLEENVVNPSFIPFVYPNGNYNKRIAELVAEEGYSLALTTENGWNNISNTRNETFRLRRVGIHQDMTSSNSMLACRIYGIY